MTCAGTRSLGTTCCMDVVVTCDDVCKDCLIHPWHMGRVRLLKLKCRPRSLRRLSLPAQLDLKLLAHGLDSRILPA